MTKLCTVCEQPVVQTDSLGRVVQRRTRHPKCNYLFRKAYQREYQRARKAADSRGEDMTRELLRQVNVNANEIALAALTSE